MLDGRGIIRPGRREGDFQAGCRDAPACHLAGPVPQAPGRHAEEMQSLPKSQSLNRPASRRRTPSYDRQAERFDERVGFGESVAAAIARAVWEKARMPEAAVLVDMGAGTGEIGRHLGRLPWRYVGIDRSARMLAVFRARLGGEERACALVAADGDATWPVADGSVNAVFSSRAIHLLDAAHVAAELRRIASPAGLVFVAGRVVRDRRSIQARMRRRLRECLDDAGFSGRRAGQTLERLAALCGERNARIMPANAVAGWTVRRSPAQALASWRDKEGLAGLTVPKPVRAEVLARVREWAAARFGSLTKTEESQERYILCGIHFPLN